jgi:hypothetical protein
MPPPTQINNNSAPAKWRNGGSEAEHLLLSNRVAFEIKIEQKADGLICFYFCFVEHYPGSVSLVGKY